MSAVNALETNLRRPAHGNECSTVKSSRSDRDGALWEGWMDGWMGMSRPQSCNVALETNLRRPAHGNECSTVKSSRSDRDGALWEGWMDGWACRDLNHAMSHHGQLFMSHLRGGGRDAGEQLSAAGRQTRGRAEGQGRPESGFAGRSAVAARSGLPETTGGASGGAAEAASTS